MTTSLKTLKFTHLVVASAAAVLVAASVGIAWADHHHHGSDQDETTSKVPVHGPGSSHNPIVYHPVHGPGSSHNPIVSKSGGNALPNGTVVRDHRNGKNCEYTVGDCRSMVAYRRCEGYTYVGGCRGGRDGQLP
jgi:hypothetical protein